MRRLPSHLKSHPQVGHNGWLVQDEQEGYHGLQAQRYQDQHNALKQGNSAHRNLYSVSLYKIDNMRPVKVVFQRKNPSNIGCLANGIVISRPSFTLNQ